MIGSTSQLCGQDVQGCLAPQGSQPVLPEMSGGGGDMDVAVTQGHADPGLSPADPHVMSGNFFFTGTNTEPTMSIGYPVQVCSGIPVFTCGLSPALHC